MVYIAVDGVPPRGKMLQQRTRRFKKIKDERELIIPLKEKHGESIVPSWNTNQLSPGTKFMAKMSKKIQKAIKEGRFCKHKKIRIILNATFRSPNPQGETRALARVPGVIP